MTAKAKNQEHPFFKLGKSPAKRDPRNIKLAAVLKALPQTPAQWDFDVDRAKCVIPTPVFANDWLGDCVMAGRAHMTLRLENFEQDGKLLPITDRIVINQYKREGGSMEPGYQGLVMLDSLKNWRTNGWTIARKKYRIHAFTQIDQTKADELKVAICFLNGVYIGLALPNSWQEQMQRGEAWHVVPGPSGRPNPHNGHCVYVCGYTSAGPVCVTWGKKQQMSWEYLATYCDEAYAIVDSRDRFVKNSPVDEAKLESLLNQL